MMDQQARTMLAAEYVPAKGEPGVAQERSFEEQLQDVIAEATARERAALARRDHEAAVAWEETRLRAERLLLARAQAERYSRVSAAAQAELDKADAAQVRILRRAQSTDRLMCLIVLALAVYLFLR